MQKKQGIKAAERKCKVSVIIPVYNGERFLEECLGSVLSQTLADIEVLCIDDGSSDGTPAILDRYAAKDGRLRVFAQENAGAGPARNLGIREAAGEYIAFMDSDDFYPSADTLEKLYAAAEANGVPVCGGGFSHLSGGQICANFSGSFAGYTFREDGPVRFSDYQFDYGFHRFLYRTAFLRKNGLFFPDYARYQDPPFLARTLAAAGTFYAVNAVTYVYRTGYKEVAWNEKRVLGLLRGLRDNLEFSSRRGFSRLHRLNWDRLNSKKYTEIIVKQARRPGGAAITRELAALQSSANGALLGFEGGAPLSRPLARLLDGFLAQDRKLREEGWFLNRRLFRLYTWPVRTLGKMLRRRKNR